MNAPADLSEGKQGFERWATRALTWSNRTPGAKWWVSRFVHYVSHRWIQVASGNRLRIHGGEAIRDMRAPRGLLLVSNHRTFWDMYVATSALTGLNDRVRDLYFPVRRRFFYTHPLGVLVNLAVSGGSMWPPMAAGFDRKRRDLVALEALARALDEPDSLVGIHPEGTRNRHSDALDLLPARSGSGHLIRACHPDVLVIPFFLCGMTDALPREVWANLRHQGETVHLVFGAPRPVGSLDRDAPPKLIAQGLLDEVRDLGASVLA